MYALRTDYLEKIKQDDVESRQDSASIVLAPRVSETCQFVASICCFSDYALLAEGHLAARASTVESDVCTSAQAAEGNLRLIPNGDTTEAVAERASLARDKELVRLCNVGGLRRNPENWAVPPDEAIKKQLGKVLHPWRRSVQTNKFRRWMLTPKDNTQKQH